MKTREKMITAKKAERQKQLEEKESWEKVTYYLMEFLKLIFILGAAWGVGYLIYINRYTADV